MTYSCLELASNIDNSHDCLNQPHFSQKIRYSENSLSDATPCHTTTLFNNFEGNPETTASNKKNGGDPVHTATWKDGAQFFNAACADDVDDGRAECCGSSLCRIFNSLCNCTAELGTLGESPTLLSHRGNFQGGEERCSYISDNGPLDYIPFNYDEEMEECSRYVFSNGSYCPLKSAHQSYQSSAAAVTPCKVSTEQPSALSTRDYTPFGGDVDFQTSPKSQLRENKTLGVEPSDTGVYQLRALLREACRHDIQRLLKTPADEFVNPLPITRSFRSLSALSVSKDASYEERKAHYISYTRHQWRTLAKSVDKKICNGVPVRDLHVMLHAQSLFNDDWRCIVREMDVFAVTNLKRQRKDRAVNLLRSLKEQGLLFALPTIHAEEAEKLSRSAPLTHDWSISQTSDRAAGVSDEEDNEENCFSRESCEDLAPWCPSSTTDAEGIHLLSEWEAPGVSSRNFRIQLNRGLTIPPLLDLVTGEFVVSFNVAPEFNHQSNSLLPWPMDGDYLKYTKEENLCIDQSETADDSTGEEGATIPSLLHSLHKYLQ